MARKISRERIRDIREQQRLREEGKIQQPNRTQRKQKAKKEKKRNWQRQIIRRGGFTPKRAKRWGDPCDWSDCPKWEDGECAYEDYGKNGCYMKRGRKVID